MAEQIITKRCCTCKQIKSLSDFYKSRHTKDGRQTTCKPCKKSYDQRPERKAYFKSYEKKYQQSEHGKAIRRNCEQSDKCKAYRKRYRHSEIGKKVQRKSSKRHYYRYPNQSKAKFAVYNAIKAGKLPRPDTLQCFYGEHSSEQYHHHLGYIPEYYLDVVPVCRKCHRQEHRNN